MKIEVGKSYRTRDGRKVKVIYILTEARIGYPVVGVLINNDGTEHSFVSCRADGKHSAWPEVSDWDLIAEWREPVVVDCWDIVCIEGPGIGNRYAIGAKTKEEAQEWLGKHFQDPKWIPVRVTGETE